jgi:hypothetical protein
MSCATPDALAAAAEVAAQRIRMTNTAAGGTSRPAKEHHTWINNSSTYSLRNSPRPSTR